MLQSLPPLDQEGLWFLDRLTPGDARYNMGVALRLEGALDPALLERCLSEVVRRHESLRTAFVSEDGEPVQRVQAGLNPELRIHGVLLTMFDARSNLANQVADELRNHFRVYNTVIPRNIRLAEAPSHGKPVILYDAGSKGSQGYLELAREILDSQAAA